jgi:hypothetical protein
VKINWTGGLATLIVLGALVVLAQQGPELIRYLKSEAM